MKLESWSQGKMSMSVKENVCKKKRKKHEMILRECRENMTGGLIHIMAIMTSLR